MLVVGTGGVAHGEPWALVGPRQQGMGGAGVAATTDSLASYWNPAAFAFEEEEWGLQLPISANASFEGDVVTLYAELHETAKTLQRKLVDPRQGRLTDDELETWVDLLLIGLPGLNTEGEGFAIAANAGLMGRYKRFGFGILGSGSGAADFFYDGIEPFVDDLPSGAENVFRLVGDGARRVGEFRSSHSLDLADRIARPSPSWSQGQAEDYVRAIERLGLDLNRKELRRQARELAAAVGNGAPLSLRGLAGAHIQGIVTTEPGIAYGHRFERVPYLGDVAIGGNLKVILGTTYQERFDLLDSDWGDVRDGFANPTGTHHEVEPGLDLGLLVRPRNWLSLGLVARNVNSPDFDFSGKGEFDLEPQVRFGVAATPLERLTLALDVDVLENDSNTIRTFRSRQVALGAEYVIPVWGFQVALRAGAYSNVASDENTDVALTAGLGVWRGNFFIEAAGGTSVETLEVDDGRSVPTRLNASIRIGYSHRFHGP